MNLKIVFSILALVGTFSLRSHSEGFIWFCSTEIQISTCGKYLKLQLEKLGCIDVAASIICDREKRGDPKSEIGCTADSTEQCGPPLRRTCKKGELTKSSQNGKYVTDADCVVPGEEKCKDGYKLARPDGPLAVICVANKDPLVRIQKPKPIAPAAGESTGVK